MKKTPFPLFHKEFPATGDRVAFNAVRHESFVGKVPPALVEEWKNFGFGAYGNGILWIPVPDEPILNTDDWPVIDGTGVEVLRTAFADVCLFQGNQFIWLNVLSGKSFSFNPNPEILFDSSIIEKHFRKSVLLERLFHIAVKRLGVLNHNECYGFAPVPALGGAIEEKGLIKTALREYIAVSAQLIN